MDMHETHFPEGIDAVAVSLCNYWLSIRGGDLAPRRADLRPSELLPLLPSLSILEYRDPGKLIYRLAGTGYMDKLGVELTGMNLMDFYPEDLRAEAVKQFDIVRHQPCGLLAHQKLISKHKTSFVAELIFLPLRGNDGTVSQLIGIGSVMARGDKELGGPLISLSKPFSFNFFDIGAGVPPSPSADKRMAASG